MKYNIHSRPSTSEDFNTGSYRPYNERESSKAYNKEQHTQHPTTVCADFDLSLKAIRPLTKGQISKKIQRNPEVRKCIDNIHYFSYLVYGKIGILNKEISEIIENPKQGKDFLLNIVENPKSVSKFAGKKIFGVKNHTRKRAERNVRPLCDAIEVFLGTVHYLRSKIVYAQMQQKNSDNSDNSERAMIQDMRHTKAKYYSILQQKLSYKIQNEASTSALYMKTA